MKTYMQGNSIHYELEDSDLAEIREQTRIENERRERRENIQFWVIFIGVVFIVFFVLVPLVAYLIGGIS